MSELLISKGYKPRKGKVFLCANCHKETYRRLSLINKSKILFCSIRCSSENVQKNKFSMNCLICKAQFFCQPFQAKYRARKTCSRKCHLELRKIEVAKRRSSGVMTQHQLDRAMRYCKQADDWRKAVFERDNYTCQMCFERGGYLEADHLKAWAFYPELRFTLSNGRTLCRECHDTTKINYKKMRENYEKEKITTEIKA